MITKKELGYVAGSVRKLEQFSEEICTKKI